MDPVEVELIAPVYQGNGHGHDHGAEAGAEVDWGGEDGVVRPQRAGAGIQEAEVTRKTVLHTGQHPEQSETISISNIDQSESGISLPDKSEARILVSRDPSLPIRDQY